MARNTELLNARNRKIAESYHELEPVLRNYSDVVAALSKMFFLSEYRIEAIIRQLVQDGDFETTGEAKKHVRKKTSSPIALTINFNF